MTRTELINSFIRRRHYRSYLEIGLGAALENFRQIECESKCGVDPSVDGGEGCVRLDSDSFFASCAENFDLIFIDGLHEDEQVDRDITNALRRLHPGGVIVLHDCLPPDEWHQRPLADFAPGENWNGAVWKSVLKYFAVSEWCCYVVDCDWGCGVIDTSRHALRNQRAVPAHLDYRRDFARLADYVISVGRFLFQQYEVTAFYHVAAMGDWKSVVAEHFRLLGKAELDAVRVSYVGDPAEVGHVLGCAAAAGVNALIVSQDPDVKAYERPAMRAIEAWVRARSPMGSILYFHTKGVSAPHDPIKRSWRQLMNYEVLSKWQKAVQQLDSFDVVGVNWRDCRPNAHFCGNFWWARSDWLSALAPFDAYCDSRSDPMYGDIGRRLACEFWISSAPRLPRVRSLVCADQDFVDPGFWSGFSHPALY